MNLRSCKYFLTVCRQGSISGAARVLLISQQSLSQHIRKLEQELGTPLFVRSNPLELTQAGQCVRQAFEQVTDTLEAMQAQLDAGTEAKTLRVGSLDYGTPDFLPPLIAQFRRLEPELGFQLRELRPGEAIPADLALIFSAKALEGGYRSELLFTERLTVCVSNTLLQKQYGDAWPEHRARLERGDLTALEGCPFVHYGDVPLQQLAEAGVARAGFSPVYLPVTGSIGALTALCANGQAAAACFLSLAQRQFADLPRCLLGERAVPACYVCYLPPLTGPAQRLLELVRRTLKRPAEPDAPEQ